MSDIVNEVNEQSPAVLERRRRPRRELDARQSHLAGILTQLPDAILSLDRNWIITFANAEAFRISRLQPDEINTRSHWELFPETIGTEVEHAYRAVMETRVARKIEYFYAPFAVWLEISVSPIEDGIALHYRDITDRKYAEVLRDDAVNRLREIFDAAPESIVCINRSWKCTFANRAALDMLKTDSLLGEDLWERFPSNRQEPFRSNYLATMERRTPTSFEAYYPQPLDIWFKVACRPFEDGIIIFASDITDRKGAELLRDASARQLSQVLETTSDAVVTLNRDWNFTFLNRRAKELLSPKGSHRTDLLGKNLWQEFDFAAHSHEFPLYCHRAMNDGSFGSFELFYPKPLYLWLAFQCHPFTDGVVLYFRDVTEERAAKQVLLDQQETLSFVQQTARVANWEIELATGAMTFGQGSYPVFGRPCSEITTVQKFRSLVVPEHLEIILREVPRAIETGELLSLDYQVTGPDGKRIWLEGRGQAVYDWTGAAITFRGMTTDITVRKQNEEALAASEARYRVLADLNPQAIWMGAPDGSITYANQGFLDFIGLSLEALLDMGWLNSFFSDDRSHVLEIWNRSITTGAEFEIEARLIRARDRQVRWWWLRARPVRDEFGKILHWLGVAMDIDDRKTFAETLQRRQEETERQRAELETVYQTAPIGLALFDPVEFRYLRLNERQAEIVGLPREQVLGRTLTEIAPIEGLREMFQQVAAGNPIRNRLLEGVLPTRPEEHRFWNVNYFPVYNAEGHVEAITAASLEITNQKRAEAALIQSEKLAAVGRLASSISHEINNPLEAITNLLYLIALNDLPDGVKSYVETAQAELSRVCQIATQTLRFHRQAVRATFVSPADLVDAVLNLYQGRLVNSNIHVEATYAVSTKILCFENDIRQVLNNLIANAIDAMRQGGRLIVRAHDSHDYHDSHDHHDAGANADPTRLRTSRKGIRITIADTGHGMSPAVRARIFEPFYTTKDLNGTGLGLWISSGIVERHHGRLTLRSSQHPVHHGTIFSLFLPHIEEQSPNSPTSK